MLSWYNVGVGGGVGVGAGVGARVGDCVGQGVGGGQPLLGQAHEVNRPKLFKTLILPFTQREHTRLSAVLSPFEYLPSGHFWHTLAEDVWPPLATSAQ